MKNILLLLRRSTNSYLLPWLIGVVMTLGMVGNIQAADAELTLVQSIEGEISTVLAGQPFTYVLKYSCSSLKEDCRNVTLTSILSPEIIGVVEEIAPTTEVNTHIKSYSVNGNIVIWQFDDPLRGGSTGELRLTVRLRNGQTPNNTVVTSTATLAGSNATTANSDPATVIVTAESVVTITKELKTLDPILDKQTKYQVTLCNKLGDGQLDLQNVAMTDSLLPNAEFEFISATEGGVYNADINAITWPARELAIGECFESIVKVMYSSANFAAGEIINQFKVTGTPVGEVEKTYTANASGIFIDTDPGTAALVIIKLGNVTVIPEGAIDYGFLVKNTGTVVLENVIITDTIPSQLVVTSIRIGSNNKPDDDSITVSVDYQTNLNPWRVLLGSPFAPTPQTIAVSSLGLGAGEYVTGLVWTYNTLPVGFKSEGNKSTLDGFSVNVLPTGRDGQPVQAGDIIENIAPFDFTYEGNVRTKVADRETEVINAMAAPRLLKNIDGVSTIMPGDVATYTLELTNMKNTTLDNPRVIDILNGNLEYVEWHVVSMPNGAPQPIFTQVDDFNGSGRIALIWEWQNYSLLRGQYLNVSFTVRVNPTTPPGHVYNQAHIVADNPSNAITVASCFDKVVDTYDIDDDGNTTEVLCASNEAIITATINPSMESIKWVKGMLDPDFHRFPASGKTSRGGTLIYQLVVENTGNVPMTDVVVVDILPFVGDTGVILHEQPRDSQWQPQLRGAVQVGTDIVVEYSLKTNPCRFEVSLTGPPGCEDPEWSTSLPSDPTTVRSLRFNFGTLVLEPLDKFKLTWPMFAPLDAPVGTIAWNSFGFVASQQESGEQLLPAEPRKVGIEVGDFKPAVLGDYVWLDVNGNGIQDEATTDGVNGVRVEVYQPGVDGQANTDDDIFLDYILTANDENGNPGYYIFSSLDEGNYFVKFFPPDGYNISHQDRDNGEADADAKDSDADPNTHVTPVVFLAAEQHDYSWDMGLIEAGTAALGDYVWFDRNQDGLQNESASSGINGLQVTLYQDNGNGEANIAEDSIVTTTFTANNVDSYPGYYLFKDIEAGQYFVKFELPNDAWFSRRDAGTSDAEDSDPNPTTGLTEIVVLSNGDVDRTLDAGIVLPEGDLSLGNRVWLDVNEDGLYNSVTENGINEVLVNLFRDTDGNGEYTPNVDMPVTSMRTHTKSGIDGSYSFENLLEDDYIVQIDASNFGMGGINPLNGLISSVGGPDPDPAIDHDDNGIPMATGNGVVSLAVTLTEPADMSDEEALRNLTVDFGFHERGTCSDPTFYALHDDALNDTQFFTVDPRTMTVADLGPLYEGYDIEGLDMKPDTSDLYATSGDDTGCIDPSTDPSTCEKHPIGHLYRVNSTTGVLTPIGSTGFDGEVSAISFNPSTSVLWAWADSIGLATIDIATGAGTLIIPRAEPVEALTWDNAGEVLYAAANTELWSASGWVVNSEGNLEPSNVGMICSDLPGQVEALEMANDDILLFALHQGNDLNIYSGKIAGPACRPQLEHIEFNTAYYDIEAITWRIGCNLPSSQ